MQKFQAPFFYFSVGFIVATILSATTHESHAQSSNSVDAKLDKILSEIEYSNHYWSILWKHSQNLFGNEGRGGIQQGPPPDSM